MAAKSGIQNFRRGEPKMSQSHKIPQLEVPPDGPASAVEQAQCLTNAAKLVDSYAQKSAPDSLDALLAAGSAATPAQAADLAREAAKVAAVQAETLLEEVDRFLALTQPRPSNAN
jgi:hypothetical protein